MSASIRAICEAVVESKETIEAHLTYLRNGIDDGRSDIRELRSDNKSLREKMDQGYARLDAKLDKSGAEINASIGKLQEGVASLRGMQVAILWLLGAIATLDGLAGAGKVFKWF
jgi:hypothetical protein